MVYLNISRKSYIYKEGNVHHYYANGFVDEINVSGKSCLFKVKCLPRKE